jgi:hypothetical protein
MKNLGRFAFPYFGDIFLLLKFSGILLISVSMWWLIPFFLLDQVMIDILIKQSKAYILCPFPFFTVFFLIMNLTRTITQPYWWIIWFLLTDLTSVGIKIYNLAITEAMNKNNEIK